MIKNLLIASLLCLGIQLSCCSQSKTSDVKYNKLTPAEESVIVNKSTEAPFTGEYTHTKEPGIYICKRCNAPLYNSKDKFDSHCGWPSFDDEIAGAVTRVPDADGMRTEIVCSRCKAHLGHVFLDEGLTDKNTRHCVNSISLVFVPAVKDKQEPKTRKAIFAGGCFWGMEYYFQNAKGVVSTRAGFTGGHKDDPTYEEVSSGTTGHAEAIEVVFDPSKTTYEELAKLFFEIHDPGQSDGQGPDIGHQYRSAVFYLDDSQKETAEKLIKILRAKGFAVVTEVTRAGTFWPANEHHQKYYQKTGGTPYCHRQVKKF